MNIATTALEVSDGNGFYNQQQQQRATAATMCNSSNKQLSEQSTWFYFKMDVRMDAISFEEQVKLVLESRKNANILVNLLEKLDSSEMQESEKIISCLQIVFKSFISQRLWHEKLEADLGPKYCEEEEKETFGSSEGIEELEGQGQVKDTGGRSIHSKADAEKIYANWVHEKYLHFVKKLLNLLNHQRKDIQKKCLNCLMQLLQEEHEAIITSPRFDPSQAYFPNTLFSRVIDGLLQCNPATMKNQLKNFDVYLKHSDIQFYSLKNIHSILNSRGKSKTQVANVRSNLCLLLLRITSGNSNKEEEDGFIITDVEQLEKFSPDSKERKKLFSNTWLSLLRLQLPNDNLKKILANLHSDVMPFMEDPKLLIDFLTDAYNLEGPVALLALNGLFLLIQKYNLDYPDFFKKLYNLIDADVFEAQHRGRFFSLMDLFLTSTTLPSYLVAAFAKRLARISLHTSPDSIKIILAVIENLMKRHPSCRLLIHRKVCFSSFN